MFRFHEITIGNEVYFLRLTTESIAQLESELGKSVFWGIKSITDNLITNLITVMWVAMLELDADFTVEQAASLYDKYIDDGHYLEDFVREINYLLKTGGLCIKDGGGKGIC